MAALFGVYVSGASSASAAGVQPIQAMQARASVASHVGRSNRLAIGILQLDLRRAAGRHQIAQLPPG
jgi:hypothetical protein